MTDSVHVFTYGLLMFPEVVQALLGRPVASEAAVLTQHQRYGLLKSPCDAPVPIILEHATGRVEGQLLRGITPAELQIFDQFEELDSGHYVRKQVRICQASTWVDAHVYVAGPMLAPYAKGEWNPAQVRPEHIQQLVQQLIPAMLATMSSTEQ